MILSPLLLEEKTISFKGGICLPLLFKTGFQNPDLSWVTEANFDCGVRRGDPQL